VGKRVDVDIREDQVMDPNTGRSLPGVVATCSECRHQTKSFGQKQSSRKRCLALMKEECPEDENNYYVDTDEMTE
jgi:hypothetical protein